MVALPSTPPSSRLRVVPDDPFFRDTDTQRAWLLRGVNLSGSCKFPKYPVPVPSHVGGDAFLTYSTLSSPISSSSAQNMNSDDAEADETSRNAKARISFVGRPFELKEADEHLARLKHWGFRMIRWVVTWEAIEHQAPGVYDQEFLDYTVQALLKVKEHGFKVMIDFHQDVWSRFSGGSGAPLWTFHLAGLDPTHFAATGAASVHNTLLPHEPLQRMVWLTNYYKLACATMFSLFYAGKILAPQCTLDQGVNIQDYLQSHFLGAIQALVDRIHACDQEEDDDEEEEGKGSQETSKINLLEDQVVIGYDSWNEPSCGWIGLERLDVLPEQHDMRQGDMPTPLQSLMLGEGLVVQDVATYRLQLIGPVKSGSRAIDPSSHASFLSSSHQQQQQQQHPVKAWLTKERRDKLDREYGIQRDASFPRAGECLWAQLGVWSIKERKVLQQDYFARGPCPSSRSWSSSSLSPSTDALGATRKGAKISWVQDHWLPFARRVAEVVRRVHPTAILFLEPPVYVPPPDLLNAAASYDKDGAPPTVDATDELEVTNGSGQGQGQDPNAELMTNMAYAPHHYDDLVLLTKRYLGWINIDLLGLSRGRNKSLLGSIKLGQKNTRMLFGNQIQAIQKECYQRLGRRPVLIGETGLHFDVGLDKALQSGNSSIMPTSVSHGKATGKDQKQSTATATATSKRFQQAFDNILDGLDRTLVHYTLWNYTPENEALYGDGWNGENLSLYSLSAPSLLQDQDDASHRHHHHHHHLGYHHPLDRGGRAVEQFCRPYPIATVGSPVKLQLDRHAKIFRLWTRSHNNKAEVTPLPPLSPPPPSLTIKEAADTTKALDARTTVIYVPNFHFLGPAHCDVKVSDGSWEWDQEQQLVSWGYGRDETGDQHWIEIRRR